MVEKSSDSKKVFFTGLAKLLENHSMARDFSGMRITHESKTYYLQRRGYKELAPGIVGKLQPYTGWFLEKGLVLPIKGSVRYIKDKHHNNWQLKNSYIEIDKDLFKKQYPWYPW